MEKLSKYSLAYILFATLVIKLLAPNEAAAQFRFEATGSYENPDSTFIEQDRYSGSIRWFPWAVDESKGPLAEAAFLSRSSSLRYSYIRSEDSTNFFAGTGPILIGIGTGIGDGDGVFDSVDSFSSSGSNTDVHSFDTLYVVADTPWIVGSRFSVTDGDFSVGDTTSDQDAWSAGLTVGYYVLNNTTLSLRSEYAESDTTSVTTLTLDFPITGVGFIGEPTSELETESVDFAIIGEHVGTLGGYSYRLSANAGYFSTETDVETVLRVIDATTGEVVPGGDDDVSRIDLGTFDGWRTGISGTWYFNDRIGLSASYQFSEFENQQSNGYGVGVSWFITRYLEVRGNYLRNNIDGPFNDLEQWGLSVRGRL